MNNELRDRIAKAVLDKILAMFAENDPVESASAYIADAILALPGIAVVELPEPERPRVGRYIWMDDLVTVNSGAIDLDYQSISATDARDLAAALLAAAEYTEKETK